MKKNNFLSAFAVLFLCLSLRGTDTGIAVADEASFTVSYERESTVAGDAGGVITFTKNGDLSSDYYHIYWADENGKLDGYTMLAAQKVSKAETFGYEIPVCTYVPEGATYLRAYSAVGTSLEASERRETDVYAEVKLPEDIKATQRRLYEFQVISDTHIRSASPTDLHSQRFINALQDIQTLSPDTSCIFINGDMVDNGYEEEWDAYATFLDYVFEDNKPLIHCSIGNHESIHYEEAQTYDSMFELFSRYTGESNPYFEIKLNGASFIMLSTTMAEADIRENGYPNYYAYLGEEQLAWLDGHLSEAAEQDQPIFLFLHQPPKETVSGSFLSRKQTWAGVVDDEALRAVIDKYPNVVMFTSHTHWHLESYGAMQYGNGNLPSFFNTASVAYLWSDEGAYASNGGSTYPGSQGLYVEVYPDYLLVKGRDFENKKWISAAQFILPVATAIAPSTSDSSEQSGNNSASGCGSAIISIPYAAISLFCILTCIKIKRHNRQSF